MHLFFDILLIMNIQAKILLIIIDLILLIIQKENVISLMNFIIRERIIFLLSCTLNTRKDG